LLTDAELLNKSVRSHWAIENNLHWNLDVIFKEDNQAKRNQTAIWV
jgi:predicted transposase YbfD/YdcC